MLLLLLSQLLLRLRLVLLLLSVGLVLLLLLLQLLRVWGLVVYVRLAGGGSARPTLVASEQPRTGARGKVGVESAVFQRRERSRRLHCTSVCRPARAAAWRRLAARLRPCVDAPPSSALDLLHTERREGCGGSDSVGGGAVVAPLTQTNCAGTSTASHR